MMPQTEPLDAISHSFLAAEVGNTTTTVSLFELVEGGYRLISRAHAPTSLRAPWLDLSHGLQQAVSRLTTITNRPLLDGTGYLVIPSGMDNSGIDDFAAVMNAAAPLKVLLVGLEEDASLSTARKLLQSCYAIEIGAFTPTDERSDEERVHLILDEKPDLILIVGGVDGADGSDLLSLLKVVALGVELLSRHDFQRPQVVYAGNRQLREQVTGLLSTHASLHMAENIRPTAKSENLAEASALLNILYEDLKIMTTPGVDLIQAWTEHPVIPTAQALLTITQYFGMVTQGNVLCLDMGSNSVVISMANNEQSWLSVRPDLGLGTAIAGISESVQPDKIIQWIDDPSITPTHINNFVLSKSINPQTIPAVAHELRLEQAISQEIISTVYTDALKNWGWDREQASHLNLILLRGYMFSDIPRPGQTMLMLLNAVQPTGVFAVSVDRYGVLPALGAIAQHQPLISVQSLEAGLMYDLGWVIAPIFSEKLDKPILNLLLEHEDGRKIEGEINAGSLELLPLDSGVKALPLPSPQLLVE